MIRARIRVFIACVTNNKGGKREDVHGRTYRYAYKKFGNEAMAVEYMKTNSWHIKPIRF